MGGGYARTALVEFRHTNLAGRDLQHGRTAAHVHELHGLHDDKAMFHFHPRNR